MHLVSYISELSTSNEMYEKFVSMFKASNENQILFLKNNLKDIKMDRGEIHPILLHEDYQNKKWSSIDCRGYY